MSESFNPFMKQPEISHVIPEQIAEADAILAKKGSSLSLAPEEDFTNSSESGAHIEYDGKGNVIDHKKIEMLSKLMDKTRIGQVKLVPEDKQGHTLQ